MSPIKLAIFCIILVSFVSLHECMSSKGFAINFMPCKRGTVGDWCCTKGGIVCTKDQADCAKSCL
ncbi:hypothetical protein N665_0212s0044 [Sinapis alba]|nr:hypothetical protein N665_0212s0043 [Sinapis alba]KAF8101004.1 hypothetical protein N665_0212s0044 [Sinapis alba]